MRETIDLACRGLSEKQIARCMNVRVRTVKNTKWEAFRLLGVRSTVAMVVQLQEERMAMQRYVVIGKYEDGTETAIVSRELIAQSSEHAAGSFKMDMEAEGHGTPEIVAVYGPYVKPA